MLVLDKRPDEPRDVIELSASQVQPAQAQGQQAAAANPNAQATEQQVGEGGASAAAGVLSAIDEDLEEAPVPDAFDYYTDNEDDAMEDN